MDITGAIYPGSKQIHYGPDVNGDLNPLAAGLLYFYTAGTSTPQDTFSDAALTTPRTNPVVLDGDGRAPLIYLSPLAYKLVLADANDVVVWTADGWSDIAQVVLATLGVTLGDGASDVVSGYTVLETDGTITVDSTGGANPCIINLPPAADRKWPLCIKQAGTVAIAVTPDGAETIDGVAAAFTIPAGASPVFPSAVFVPRGSSNWILQASHKIP